MFFDTINTFSLCCFSGWWSWNVFECGSICSLGLIMHVFANLHHQNFHSQMGSSHVHVLLYSIHCNPILPPILYNNPRSNHCWNRSCPDVECEVYIPNSSKNIKNILRKRCMYIKFSWCVHIILHLWTYILGWKQICRIEWRRSWAHHCTIFWNIFSIFSKLVCLGTSH